MIILITIEQLCPAVEFGEFYFEIVSSGET